MFLYFQWYTIFALMNHDKFHSLDVCNCNCTFHMSCWEVVRACTELNVRWNQHKCLKAWNKPNRGWDTSLYSKPVSTSESRVKYKCILLLPKNTLGLIRKYYFLERKWKSLSRLQLFATPWTIWSMEFSRPDTGFGSLSLPFTSPGDLPKPEIKPRFPAVQEGFLPAEPQANSKNTGVSILSLLQWILPTQESNQGLLHWRQVLYQLSYQGIIYLILIFQSSYLSTGLIRRIYLIFRDSSFNFKN